MPTLHHLLLPLLLAPALALAELRWSVETSRYIDNWNGWAGIYECSEYVYLVSLDEGITCTLSTFTVPAGSDLGVYDAAAPEGWESHILPDCTVIHVTTGGVPIPATGGATFYLYSTLIGVNTNAWAEGVSAYNGPFAPARVSVPALCRRA